MRGEATSDGNRAAKAVAVINQVVVETYGYANSFFGACVAREDICKKKKTDRPRGFPTECKWQMWLRRMLNVANCLSLIAQQGLPSHTKLTDVVLYKLRNVWIECWLTSITALHLNPNAYRLNTALCRNQMPIVDEMHHAEVGCGMSMGTSSCLNW